MAATGFIFLCTDRYQSLIQISVLEVSIQPSLLVFQLKLTRDEKEAEKNRKREEKKEKKRQEKQEKLQKKKEERVRKKEEEFRRKKMSKGNNSRYFGHPLTEICPENIPVPIFVTKCIEYVERCGE